MSEQWTTILVGNGLGMALDPAYFKIERGLSYAWDILTPLQQERIKKLVTDQSNLTSEEQLDKHYAVIQACLMLSKIEQHSNLAWLDSNAREFPSIFREFVSNVARYFFNYPAEENIQLDTFLKNLKKFILDNNTHLVTLNYDKLIYDRFAVDTDIMNFNHAKLIDGFHVKTTGFDPSHLSDPEYRNNMGYYLHLHGSPLFYTNYDNGIINKSKFEYYENDILNPKLFQEHLILCATTLKPTQISNSLLLRSYWDFFNVALEESKKIILFGYSGNDVHINSTISKMRYRKEIIIIEHDDQMTTEAQRKQYWSDRLNIKNEYFTEENFKRLTSIVEYNFEKDIP